MINYNTSKPPEPPKKLFSYQALYLSFSFFALIFIFNEIFIYDLSVISKMGFEKASKIDLNKLYVILNVLGSVAIPICAFLIEQSVLKDKKFSYKLIAPVLCYEIIYDLYAFDKFFEYKFQSVAIAFLLGALYSALYRKYEEKWWVNVFLSIAFLVISAVSGIDKGVIIAAIFVILNFFENNLKAQSLFSFVASIAGGGMVLGNVFIYFYDGYYNRKRIDDYLNWIFVIVALLVWRIRVIILG